MVVRTTAWPAGTPCWVDLGADVDRAKSFYGPLFGWEFTDGDEQFGGYSIISKDGHRVAGLGPRQNPDQPAVWTVYLATDDVAATLKSVADAGGQIIADRMPIADQGAMAIAVDTAGAVFGLWESGTNTGADLANAPGSLVWNEHMSTAFPAAKDFYAKVFGYTYAPVEGAGETYNVIDVAGAPQPVAGIGEGEAQGWSTYFQVEDADTTIAKAKDLGATLQFGPEDTPYGRMASLTDNQGTPFNIMGNVPEM